MAMLYRSPSLPPSPLSPDPIGVGPFPMQMAALERKLESLRLKGHVRLPDSCSRMSTFGPRVPSTLSFVQAKETRDAAVAAEVAAANAVALEEAVAVEQGLLANAAIKGLSPPACDSILIRDKMDRRALSATEAATSKTIALLEATASKEAKESKAAAERAAAASKYAFEVRATAAREAAAVAAKTSAEWRRLQLEEAARIQVAAAELNLEKTLSEKTTNFAAKEAAALAASQELRRRVLEDATRAEVDADLSATNLEWRRRLLEDAKCAQLQAATKRKMADSATASILQQKMANDILDEEITLATSLRHYPYSAKVPSRPRSVSPQPSVNAQACLSSLSAIDEVKTSHAVIRARQKAKEAVAAAELKLTEGVKDYPYTSLNCKSTSYPLSRSVSPVSSPMSRKRAINLTLEGPEPEPTVNGRLYEATSPSGSRSPMRRLYEATSPSGSRSPMRPRMARTDMDRLTRMLDEAKAQMRWRESKAEVDAMLRAEARVAKAAEDVYLNNIKSAVAAETAAQAVEQQSRQELARAAVKAQAAEEVVLIEKMAQDVVVAEEALSQGRQKHVFLTGRDDAVAPWRVFAPGSSPAIAPRRLFESRRN